MNGQSLPAIVRRLYVTSPSAEVDFFRDVSIAPLPATSEGALLQQLSAARQWLRKNTDLFVGIDDSKLPATPRRPVVVAGATTNPVSLIAYLVKPDDAEFLVFGFEAVDFAKGEYRSATSLFAAALEEVAVDVGNSASNVTATDIAAEISESRDEIAQVHKDIAQLMQTSADTLAQRMRADAIAKGVLQSTTSSAPPPKTWFEAYNKTDGAKWMAPEDRYAVEQVFEEFGNLYRQQTSNKGITTFDQVYNSLRSDSFRTVLVLSTWLIPFTNDFRRPAPGTPEYSSFFTQEDGRKLLNDVQKRDPTLSGKKLQKKLAFA